MIKKFSFLISMINTLKHDILLCLMALYSAFSYGTHAAGMDITYECVGGSSSSSGVQVTVTINTDLFGNEMTVGGKLFTIPQRRINHGMVLLIIMKHKQEFIRILL